MQPEQRLTFGCHNITGGSSSRRSIRLIHCALDHGISHFDVAPSYGVGTAEAILGAAIKKRAASVQITTKFGIEPPRFGQILAWGREPFRILRSLFDRTPALHFGRPKSGELRSISLAKSLERSLLALGTDRVHTLLSHEQINVALATEYLHELEQARTRGSIELFGCSGERRAVEQSLAIFGNQVQVVQVSVDHSQAFKSSLTHRIFGAVRTFGPRIDEHLRIDKAYRDDLLSALFGVRTFKESVALAAIAVARVLVPHASLLVNSSNESHIVDIARFSNDRTLFGWATAYRAIHEDMLSKIAYSYSLSEGPC
jgi:predicted oxidoreductase